jgi:hypothetical protein
MSTAAPTSAASPERSSPTAPREGATRRRAAAGSKMDRRDLGHVNPLAHAHFRTLIWTAHLVPTATWRPSLVVLLGVVGGRGLVGTGRRPGTRVVSSRPGLTPKRTVTAAADRIGGLGRSSFVVPGQPARMDDCRRPEERASGRAVGRGGRPPWCPLAPSSRPSQGVHPGRRSGRVSEWVSSRPLGSVHPTACRAGRCGEQDERALAIGEAALGPDHPTVAAIRGNLDVPEGLPRTSRDIPALWPT